MDEVFYLQSPVSQQCHCLGFPWLSPVASAIWVMISIALNNEGSTRIDWDTTSVGSDTSCVGLDTDSAGSDADSVGSDTGSVDPDTDSDADPVGSNTGTVGSGVTITHSIRLL